MRSNKGWQRKPPTSVRPDLSVRNTVVRLPKNGGDQTHRGSQGEGQPMRTTRQSFTKTRGSKQFSTMNDQQYSSPRYDRYDMAARSLQDRQDEKKGKLVTFIGDRGNKVIRVSVNERMFPQLSGLLLFLNQKMDTVSGVRHIFRKETGKEVKDVSEIEAGDVCIVSSTSKTKKINFSDPFGPSPTKSINSTRGHSFNRNAKTNSHNSSPHGVMGKSNKPIGINIVSNSIRSSRKKMMLNPQTTQPFEDMLVDIGMIVKMEQPPATSLHMAVAPYTKIDSFSKLFRELETTDTFFVCGGEGIPKELKKEIEHQSREPSRQGPKYAPALQTADDDEPSPIQESPRGEGEEDDGGPAPATARYSRARAPRERMETPEC